MRIGRRKKTRSESKARIKDLSLKDKEKKKRKSNELNKSYMIYLELKIGRREKSKEITENGE